MTDVNISQTVNSAAGNARIAGKGRIRSRLRFFQDFAGFLVIQVACGPVFDQIIDHEKNNPVRAVSAHYGTGQVGRGGNHIRTITKILKIARENLPPMQICRGNFMLFHFWIDMYSAVLILAIIVQKIQIGFEEFLQIAEPGVNRSG